MCGGRADYLKLEVQQTMAQWIVSALDPCLSTEGASIANPPDDRCLVLSRAKCRNSKIARILYNDRYARVFLGYSHVKGERVQVFESAHRLALWLRKGFPGEPAHPQRPPGAPPKRYVTYVVALHRGAQRRGRRCNRRGSRCVNPLHLQWGTHKLNVGLTRQSKRRNAPGDVAD